MYYIYIIQSNIDGSFYTGQCKNLSERLKHHNNGYTKSTKAKTPWQLVYYEPFDTRTEASRREIEIKKKKSRLYL
jgi:putative endonuclease